ncbi:exonuclease SbcC [Limosilactobacillus caecicola]|uniref:exonuclease SbcC n=1 Tax=Limosilactobacillus caecicola TaxID=2941332 RepID=UPI0020408590|nr:exonuclease SbcC [Limosilactobacillus caecicola]
MATEQYDQGHLDVGQTIDSAIAKKIDYLSALKAAVADHQDTKIYELLDNQRYAAEIEHREQQANDAGVMNLVDNLTNQLSHFLSENLIDYLGKAYPFFYYEEYQTGHYRIYFGNWWDRRQFGDLDVLNIRFAFNQDEYGKLADSFKLSEQGKKYNSEAINKLSAENDHLQELIDSATTREQKRAELQNELKDANSRSGLFESSKNKEARQEIVDQISKLEDENEEARGAKAHIKENNQKVLELSKENTILSYEQKSIVDTFGSFEDFELANRNLYANYLKHLAKADGGKQVADNE